MRPSGSSNTKNISTKNSHQPFPWADIHGFPTRLIPSPQSTTQYKPTLPSPCPSEAFHCTWPKSAPSPPPTQAQASHHTCQHLYPLTPNKEAMNQRSLSSQEGEQQTRQNETEPRGEWIAEKVCYWDPGPWTTWGAVMNHQHWGWCESCAF